MKSSDVNDDMGQVEYVFMDKSGTITQNRFRARIAYIANCEYWFTEERPTEQNFSETSVLNVSI